MATATASLWHNPLGTDGFEFVEYAAPDPAALGRLFEQMGFSAIARHRSKNVLLYRQGGVNFIVNAEPDSFAQGFARVHGPSICAMAFRVKDAALAYRRTVEQGAWGVEARPGPMELNIPAIKGIGDSLIYLVDRYPGADGSEGSGVSIYDIDFVPFAGVDQHPRGAGLTAIDHLTHNVHRGRMEEWAGFYERLFNFREVRYFDIEGQLTGLKSKAMTSPCGKIRIPINESSDDKSQIQEYLVAYHGEGIQHVALGADDIYADGRALARQAGRVPADAGHVLRPAAGAVAGAHGGCRALAAEWHTYRRGSGEGRDAAADFHDHRDRPDLLRDHPAQGQRGLRRRQLPRPVRVDRAGPDPPRSAEGLARAARSPVVLSPVGFALLRCLADGELHSGEALAATIGMTRARVSQLLKQAESSGLALERVRGRGYRLVGATPFLDRAALAARTCGARRQRCGSKSPITSTRRAANCYAATRGTDIHGLLLAAEWQTAGRGRRGRRWTRRSAAA